VKNSIGSKQTSVYILHEPDATFLATRLRAGILAHTEATLCYLGIPTSDEEMAARLGRIPKVTYLIFLQTRNVLMHEWPLLAAYGAALAEAPMVCVAVDEGGYDFESIEHHLKHLNEELDDATVEHIHTVLSGWTPSRTFHSLQSKLFNVIPQIISVMFNPSGTDNEFVATITDIDDKQDLMQTRYRRRSNSFEDGERLRRRASRLSKLMDLDEQLAEPSSLRWSQCDQESIRHVDVEWPDNPLGPGDEVELASMPLAGAAPERRPSLEFRPSIGAAQELPVPTSATKDISELPPPPPVAESNPLAVILTTRDRLTNQIKGFFSSAEEARAPANLDA